MSTQDQNPDQPQDPEQGGDAFALLAWAGWQLWMPEGWQPLKLMGTPDKGEVIVGNNDVAIFVLKWECPRDRGLSDGSTWVEKRMKQHGVLPQTSPPAKEHFTATGWAKDVQTEEGKKTTYWYGYAARAGLLIGVTVNGVLDAGVRAVVTDQILPTLRATPEDAERQWSMYEVQFTAPAGFGLARRHLFSGDVALLFERGKRETLLVRQVYPGDLALKRRSWEKWLNVAPFKEHRHLRPRSMRVRTWQHPEQPGLAGMQRTGWKRIPVPLGWYAPRRAHALGVHDVQRNRLLIAEHTARDEAQDKTCRRAIDGMNRFPARPRNRVVTAR